MKEEELYLPVRNFFKELGYEVYSEVNYCDVTAVKDGEVIVTELKKSLSVELLIQGVLRQKLSENVYIAVPKYGYLKKGKDLKNIIYLLRRLELGLLLVDLKNGEVEVAVSPKPFDIEKSRKRSINRRNSLEKEIMGRTEDMNTGGSKGKKLVTAYREQAIYVSCILNKFGTLFPAQIKKLGGNGEKTLGILKNNYYGWFERTEDGRYFLNSRGRKELEDYKILTDNFYRKIKESNKILYISDLDGTLLNNEAALSQKTEELLNRLIGRGVLFSVATARTAATVTEIFRNVNIDLPVVLMNGAAIYDIKLKKYVEVNKIFSKTAGKIIKILESFGIKFFMYVINEERLTVFYKEPDRASGKAFLKDRLKNKNKKFILTRDYNENIGKGQVIYFSMLGDLKELSDAFESVSLVPGVRAVIYKDVYSEDWFMEIFSSKASKSGGMKELKEYSGADLTVGFGDNMNDLDLLKKADISCAVKNAKDEVKNIADIQIGSNEENGVAEFIFNIES